MCGAFCSLACFDENEAECQKLLKRRKMVGRNVRAGQSAILAFCSEKYHKLNKNQQILTKFLFEMLRVQQVRVNSGCLGHKGTAGNIGI